MSKRNFAAALSGGDGQDEAGFEIELQPSVEVAGLDGKLVIRLKDGATKSQAAELQSQLNLLGLTVKVATDR